MIIFVRGVQKIFFFLVDWPDKASLLLGSLPQSVVTGRPWNHEGDSNPFFTWFQMRYFEQSAGINGLRFLKIFKERQLQKNSSRVRPSFKEKKAKNWEPRGLYFLGYAHKGGYSQKSKLSYWTWISVGFPKTMIDSIRSRKNTRIKWLDGPRLQVKI